MWSRRRRGQQCRFGECARGFELDLSNARRVGIDPKWVNGEIRRSPGIGFSPIALHAPLLRNGNASPQSRDLLTTTWVGTSIRMVLVQTPARFPRRTLRQREIRSVGRQKTRPTDRSRGRTARRIRRYRHRVPAIHTRRAFITIHCDDRPSIKGAIPGVWVRPGC